MVSPSTIFQACHALHTDSLGHPRCLFRLVVQKGGGGHIPRVPGRGQALRPRAGRVRHALPVQPMSQGLLACSAAMYDTTAPPLSPYVAGGGTPPPAPPSLQRFEKQSLRINSAAWHRFCPSNVERREWIMAHATVSSTRSTSGGNNV
jgi:hypothetical protein